MMGGHLTADRRVAGCARSLTHLEVRSLPCSTPPWPELAIAAIRSSLMSTSNQFDLDDLGGITAALAEADDPGEAGGPIGVLRGDLIEQLADDEDLTHRRPALAVAWRVERKARAST